MSLRARMIAPLVLALAPAACARPAARAADDSVTARIARIERDLLPTTRVEGRTYTPATIEQRMRVHGVPAVSVAVVNGGRIEWAKAWGMADSAAGVPATTSTLFQAASISKPVAALGALRLVEQGRLSLDEDVNAKLISWKVPANEFTARQPVTLRLILSHAAGLTVHGFPGYAPGVAVPTVVQLLNGEPPANTAPVRVDILPGSRWRYSGGGYTVMQLLMTDVTSESFPALMRRLVLEPAGMTSSTYEQPLPARLAGHAATGYRSGGQPVTGRFHTYPEMAAAGLWTTPSDLARYLIEVQRSLAGTSNRVLSREMTAAMLTPGVGSHGLGPGVDGRGDSLGFGHGGANEGFRANMTAFAARGQGAALMTNSDDGSGLISEILQAIAREYGWPGFRPRMLASLALTPEAVAAYTGRYVLEGAARPVQLVVSIEDGQVLVRQNDGRPIELVPTAPDVFTPLAPAPPFQFERDSAGAITALVVGGTRLARRPPSAPSARAAADRYPHAAEPIGTVRQIYDGALTPELAVSTFRNIDRLFSTRTVPRSSRPLPLPPASRPLTTVRFSDGGRSYDLDDYIEKNRVTAMLVLHDGRVALERYRFGNGPRTRWMSMSVAKSISSTLVGAALKDGYIGALSDPVTRYVPSLAGSAYDGVTIRDVLMMSSGVRWTETYTDPGSDRRRLLEAQISQVPGSAMAVMKSLPRAAAPGSVNTYSTGETQIVAEVLRGAVGRPLATYLAERIWEPFGMESDANWWLDSPDGVEIGGSGFSATLRDYGRFGLFLLGGGRAGGKAVLPDGWIPEATSPKSMPDGSRLDYGYLWWPGTTPSSRRDGAYAGFGIYGQILYVNPAARVVVVVWGAQAKPTGGDVVDDWAFLDAVSDALR